MPTWAWAYEFNCELTPDQIAAKFNDAGPWTWSRRESEWYGDYLICRPAGHMRLRIHDRSEHFFGSDQFERGPRYKCQLETSANFKADRDAIDPIFLNLVAGLLATDLKAIDPYD
jgi:hypothetical protein